MRSDGFEYLKENCPSLQSEILKTVAGCEEEVSGGGKSRDACSQFSNGATNQTINPQFWANLGVRTQILWDHIAGGADTTSSWNPGQQS